MPKVLIAKKSAAEAYASPYLDPIKPVLHNKTKMSGTTDLNDNDKMMTQANDISLQCT